MSRSGGVVIPQTLNVGIRSSGRLASGWQAVGVRSECDGSSGAGSRSGDAWRGSRSGGATRGGLDLKGSLTQFAAIGVFVEGV